jgi:NAD(P)-dependent dehydrogenase (short-subunit alcohol dehydrogenase family)
MLDWRSGWDALQRRQPMGLQDKVVLVTGATGGLGPTVVRAVLATGARLVLTARKQEALAALVQEEGLAEERTFAWAADLSKVEDVQALLEALAARWGGPDVLFNLAGGWRGGTRLAEMAEGDFHETMQINLLSAFHINRAVLPYMVGRGWGRIVNIASRAAVTPGAKQAAYNIAKAGVVALTASVAAEYGRQGVVANVILPSIIDDPANRAGSPNADYTRWVKPEEVAAMLLFLASEEAAALNGASIPLYGRL